MGEGKRSERVADLIQKEISDMLTRSIKDPRIGFVTITRVSVTDDCRSARIFYSVVGTPSEREASMKGLESARGYIRKELGRRVSLRYVPEIAFQFDPSVEYAIHIEEVIRSLHPEETGEDED